MMSLEASPAGKKEGGSGQESLVSVKCAATSSQLEKEKKGKGNEPERRAAHSCVHPRDEIKDCDNADEGTQLASIAQEAPRQKNARAEEPPLFRSRQNGGLQKHTHLYLSACCGGDRGGGGLHFSVGPNSLLGNARTRSVCGGARGGEMLF